MKKVLRCLVLAGLGIALTACGSGSKTETATYKMENNGMTATITLEHEDDKVMKQTSVSELVYEEAGTTKDQFQITADAMSNQFEDIKGVEYSMDIGDDKATEKISVDYSKADVEEIAGLTGSVFESTDDASSVSFEKTVKILEKQGYKKSDK